jgi:hypothetical protein
MGLEVVPTPAKERKTMTSNPIVSCFDTLKASIRPPLGSVFRFQVATQRPNLHELYQHPEYLPRIVRESHTAMRFLELLGPLDWRDFPERDLSQHWDPRPVPYAPFAAACLVRLEQRFVSMGQLRKYLVECPELVWLLGFPLPNLSKFSWLCEVVDSLPTRRHLTWMLRHLPNSALQYLLSSSVAAICSELEAVKAMETPVGDTVSMDTQHILAWVKENNPKTYIKQDRFNKEQQPAGDPDCRLGCKRRHNQRASAPEPPATPAHNPVPAETISVGEFYWGYASGIVAVKVPKWGEFVVAELTQPFDRPDVAYFLPLMEMVAPRLGRKPRLGALDAAYDAFYVYDYFHEAGGFAAVPFSERGGYKNRKFDADGAPFCQADLAMKLRYTFTNRSGLIEHPYQRYACPLLFPEPTDDGCPIAHKQWHQGGCTSTLASGPGARLRYTMDRQDEKYKQVYRQRTASECIFSQAVQLGIERPRLRNGQAIANLNTLIYTLINLHFLQRIRRIFSKTWGEAKICTNPKRMVS